MSEAAMWSMLAGMACGVSGFVAGTAFAFAWRIRIARNEPANAQPSPSQAEPLEAEPLEVSRVECRPSTDDPSSDPVATTATSIDSPAPAVRAMLAENDRTGWTDSQIDALPADLPVADPRRRRRARPAKPVMHHL